MKIGIHTWGSEGTIRPFLALAEGLVQAGHEVRLVYSTSDGTDYSASLTDVGYEHQELASAQPPADFHRMGEEIFSDASTRRQLSRILQELLDPALDALAESARELAKWADVLVLQPIAHPLSAAAEVEGKPFVCVYTGSTIATREFPPPGLPDLGVLNLLTWKLYLSLLSASCVGAMNRIRGRFGLRPVKRAQQQLQRSAIDLVAMSPTLLPRPNDWPVKVHIPGFLNARPPSRTEKLSPELRGFLADGPAPVYVSFGGMSMAERNPRALVELAEEAIEAAGCRAIVQSDAPAQSSPKVFRAHTLPQAQVLPQCSAIIHQGGPAATQAAVLAGRPSIVVAHMTDQFMWGRQLHKLGVAPSHLSRSRLDTKQLTQAIQKATQDQAMRAQAERLREQLRREDGVRRAVELIGLQQPH